jgi:hypothetical protein
MGEADSTLSKMGALPAPRSRCRSPLLATGVRPNAPWHPCQARSARQTWPHEMEGGLRFQATETEIANPIFYRHVKWKHGERRATAPIAAMRSKKSSAARGLKRRIGRAANRVSGSRRSSRHLRNRVAISGSLDGRPRTERSTALRRSSHFKGTVFEVAIINQL